MSSRYSRARKRSASSGAPASTERRKALTSAPAQNWPPSPRSTSKRTAGSSSIRSSASCSASIMSRVRALRAAGRASVNVATLRPISQRIPVRRPSPASSAVGIGVALSSGGAGADPDPGAGPAPVTLRLPLFLSSVTLSSTSPSLPRPAAGVDDPPGRGDAPPPLALVRD